MHYLGRQYENARKMREVLLRPDRIWLVLLILVGLAIPLNAQTPGSLVETAKKLQRSICPVGVVKLGSNGEHEFVVEGTGFFVGEKGQFVTALHVAQTVQEADKATPAQQAAVCVPRHGWPRGDEKSPVSCTGFKIVRSDSENDLALCLTNQNPFNEAKTKNFVQAVTFDDNLPPDGTEVVFVGFPSSNMVPMVFRGFVSSYQNLARGRESGPMLLIQGSDLPGFSGGPVCLEDGRVVGMILGAGEQRFKTLTGARPSSRITPLLKEEVAGH